MRYRLTISSMLSEVSLLLEGREFLDDVAFLAVGLPDFVVAEGFASEFVSLMGSMFMEEALAASADLMSLMFISHFSF